MRCWVLWQHYGENYNTAPLDARYTDRWDAMPLIERSWAVANGDVGHVPVPSAAVLIPIALALWMTTLGIPRKRARTTGPDG